MGLTHRLLTNLRRAGLSLLLAGAVVAIASSALYAAGAPRLVSLLIEPVSLFLMPGLIIALATAGSHDFSAQAVLVWSLAVYSVLFFLLLSRRASERSHDAFR